MADQEFLSVTWFRWFGTGVVALWMSLFGMQWRMISQRVTRDEHDDFKQSVDDRFKNEKEVTDAVHNAITERIGGIEKWLDRMREDAKDSEGKLADLIQQSEGRLMKAIDRVTR